MSRIGAVVGDVGLLVLLGLAIPAWATMDDVKAYKEAYPGKDAKAYGCKACHLNAIGKKGELNAYGEALVAYKAPADAKKLTAEDILAIDKEDADKDGAANGDEIKGGTLPGDATSHP